MHTYALTWKFSTAPLVFPGRFTIRDFPLIPQVNLDNIAIGVTFREPVIIAWTNPGASLSMTSLRKKIIIHSTVHSILYEQITVY